MGGKQSFAARLGLSRRALSEIRTAAAHSQEFHGRLCDRELRGTHTLLMLIPDDEFPPLGRPEECSGLF